MLVVVVVVTAVLCMWCYAVCLWCVSGCVVRMFFLRCFLCENSQKKFMQNAWKKVCRFALGKLARPSLENSSQHVAWASSSSSSRTQVIYTTFLCRRFIGGNHECYKYGTYNTRWVERRVSVGLFSMCCRPNLQSRWDIHQRFHGPINQKNTAFSLAGFVSMILR